MNGVWNAIAQGETHKPTAELQMTVSERWTEAEAIVLNMQEAI